MALTKVSGHIIDQPFDVGIITATNQYVSGIGTFGNIRVLGDLQVDGTTTTLDTVVTEVDRLEVGANNNTVGVAITQSGTGDIFNLYDGSTEVFTVTDGGRVGIGTFDVDSAVKLQVNAAILMAGNGQGDGQTGIEIGHGSPGVGTAHHRIRTGGGAGQNLIIEGQTAASGGDVIFKTGGTNNRLRVTSAGKVGINEDNPETKLVIRDTLQSTASNHYSLIVKGDDNGTDGESAYIFLSAIDAFTRGASIGAERKSSSNDHDLIFKTSAVSATPTERLRITSDGKVRVPDGGKFVAGAGDDLQIYHDGSNSYIADTGTGGLILGGNFVSIRKNDLSEQQIIGFADAQVQLYYDNSKKFETTSSGVTVTGSISCGDNDKINLGDNDDLQISHDGATSIISGMYHPIELRHQSEVHIKCVDDGAVELYHNNVKKLETSSGGVNVTGELNVTTKVAFPDNAKAIFGAGDDLQIYHDGSHNRIKSLTGGLYIHVANGEFLSQNGSEVIAKFLQNAAVELYYDNSKKLETTTTGAKVTGALEVTQEYPSIRPTLDLNFAATKTLDRRITFRRGSIGTFTDDMGIVRYASNNVPRFDHDPTTGESLGLLIEESRTNDFAHSDPGNDVWLSNNGVVKTANTTDTKAPDGSFTATKLASQATANSTSQIYDTLSKSSGGVQSVWAKKGTHNVLGIYDLQGAQGIRGWFDLNTGEHRCEGGSKVAAGVQSNGNDTNNTNMIEYPNGWYRCIYYEAANMTYGHFRIADFDSDSEASSSSNTIYLWGIQAEVNKTFATSFIPSLSATMPATNSTRSQDTAKIDGTNFTDFYNQEEGTLVAHYDSRVDDGYLAQLESVTTPGDDRIGLVNYVGYQGFVETGNSTQASLDNGTPTVGAVNKVAFAFKTNDFAVSLNSATPVTDTSGTMPTVGRMMIGSRYGGAYDILKSSIRRLSYYPKRLPNAQLQGLTQQ